MRRHLIAALGLLAAILLLAACGGDDPTATPRPSETPIPPSATPRPTSTPVVVPEVETDPTLRGQFRLVDASADLPPVDIYLDAALIGSRFVEGSYSTQSLTFGAGTYTLRVIASGSVAGDAPLLDYELMLEAGDSQILLLLGTPEEPSIVAYSEDLSTLPVETARISAIHAAPGSEPFDVWLSTTPLFEGVAFGPPAGPETVEAGAQHVEFRRGASVFRAMDLQLGQRIAYTFVLAGTDEDSQIITLQSQVELLADVRVIHAAQGASRVDVLVDDELLAGNLAYGASTDWQHFPAQSRTLRVVPSGSENPIYEAPLTLHPDRALDLILIGGPDGVSVAQIEEDLSPTPQNATRLLFVNAAPDASRVTVSTYSGPVDAVAPLDYGFASAPLDMLEHESAYVFSSTGDDAIVVGETDSRLWAAGHSYMLIATGDNTGRAVLFDAEVGTNDSVIDTAGTIADESAGMDTYRVRVINARLDGGPIDVTLGDEVVATGTVLGAASSAVEIPRGTRALVVRDTDSGAVLVESDYEPPADVTEATLFVYGQGASVQVVTASDNLYGSLSDGAWLRVFHGNPDQPDLRIDAQGPADVATGPNAAPTPAETPLPPETTLVDRARYGEPTTAETVATGTYRVHVLTADTNFRIYTEPLLTLQRDTFYDMLILPDATGLSIQIVLIPRE
ncbi:DUF4397 domain-containing protein [Aggregatilinea lenta]|uniref:DUF4397 domain-containing protein n=1 Tax=Aggregatilinea lenta TaxID=913108 RepID=UPI0013C2E389|nr:DUF4397 domain-containing protein [Aggregatilinea lenta]